MDTHSVTTYPVDTAYYYYTNISHFFKGHFIPATNLFPPAHYQRTVRTRILSPQSTPGK